MAGMIDKARGWLREFRGRLSTRRDSAPIDSVARLEEFIAAHAAYVAQKTLFEYVKARMGTRYPRMFEDDLLMESLNIAKFQVFAACLSDLTVYAVGEALHDQPIGNDGRAGLARRCFESGLRGNTAEAPKQFSAAACCEEFERRLADTEWRSAREPHGFAASPPALLRWAPIADQLKQFDAEIVQNSIKFAWRDVREQFSLRVADDAICADWSRIADAD